MKRQMLKSKLHRACVTQTDLTYEGSITVDPQLCEQADIKEFEKVEIYNCNTGARFSTYVIFGGKGDICLNGAAARLVHKDDRVIIVSFAEYSEEECDTLTPILLLLDENNQVVTK